MRLAYRVSIEIVLFVAGAWAGGAPRVLLWTAAGAGAIALFCSGEVRLAVRCPAADAALRTLDRDIGHFRDFFPSARRDLINAAARALEAQRVLLRTDAALAEAPPGEGRILLEAQRTKSWHEIAGLTLSLRELRARLIASTQPLPAAIDPALGLRALEDRTSALSRELQS